MGPYIGSQIPNIRCLHSKIDSAFLSSDEAWFCLEELGFAHQRPILVPRLLRVVCLAWSVNQLSLINRDGPRSLVDRLVVVVFLFIYKHIQNVLPSYFAKGGLF